MVIFESAQFFLNWLEMLIYVVRYFIRLISIWMLIDCS